MCWQKELTSPFLNAPPPLTTHPPSHFNISFDRTVLRDIFTPTLPLNPYAFLSKSFTFACHFQNLGIVTNFCNDLSYALNSISHPIIELLVSLHDYLVDSSKNGYIFTVSSWQAFLTTLNLPGKTVPQPPYKRAADEPLFDSRTTTPRHVPWKTDNIIDHLIYGTARPHAISIIHAAHALTPSIVSAVASPLHALFLSTLSSADPSLAAVAKALDNDGKTLLRTWKSRIAQYLNTPAPSALAGSRSNPSASRSRADIFDAAITDAHASFAALLPALPYREDHAIVEEWMQAQAEGWPTKSNLVKASWAAGCGSGEFGFGVAGWGICCLRAFEKGDGRPVVMVGEVA